MVKHKQIQWVSSRTVERLALYRRAILRKSPDWGTSIFSHQLANLCGVTAAQVRRDLMAVGYTGSPITGYELSQLLESIGLFLDSAEATPVAIVGVGDLGRAVIHFLANRRPKLVVTAAFDADPSKTDRVIHGVRCHRMERLTQVLTDQAIEIAIVAVPASEAQIVCDRLVEAKVRGILSFAPAFLRVPDHVVVERLDVTVALEKVAFLARSPNVPRKKST